MNTVYNVDYFINKFSAIPEQHWGVDAESFLGDELGRKCALGHCRKDEMSFDYNSLAEEGKTLVDLFTYNKEIQGRSKAVWMINDGCNLKYQQPTAKQRILAALWDIKKLSYPELSETTVNDLIGEKDLHEKH